MFKNETCINNISVSGVGINNIYNKENRNNISDISQHVLAYYQSIDNGKRNIHCKINSFAIVGVFVNTACRQNSVEQTVLPNIFIRDIESRNGTIDTTVGVLSTTLSSSLNKNDNRSFLDKIADYVVRNPTVKIAALDAGLVKIKDISSAVNNPMYLTR